MEQPDVVKSQLSLLKKKTSTRRSTGVANVAEGREEKLPSSVDQEAISELERGLGLISTAHNLIGIPCHHDSVVKGSPIIKWACQECLNECIPVMRESRCLCGHRMKEHKLNSKDNITFPCSAKSCRCRHFFYLVAEGAWILRCRCKHKHTDHECGPGVHKCLKCSACGGFDSPWVCNCGHTWSSHKQQTVVITENNIAAEFGPEPALRKQHFYRQDGLEDQK